MCSQTRKSSDQAEGVGTATASPLSQQPAARTHSRRQSHSYRHSNISRHSHSCKYCLKSNINSNSATRPSHSSRHPKQTLTLQQEALTQPQTFKHQHEPIQPNTLHGFPNVKHTLVERNMQLQETNTQQQPLPDEEQTAVKKQAKLGIQFSDSPNHTQEQKQGSRDPGVKPWLLQWCMAIYLNL